MVALQRRLYRDFYCCGSAARRRKKLLPPVDGRTPFIEQLSAANQGQGVWQDHWEPLHDTGGDCVVARNGIAVRAPRLNVARSGADGARTVRVKLPKEFLRLSPGFYVAVGDHDFAENAEARLWRFYWHLGPHGALQFVRTSTALLNREGIPFRAKVVADPSHYGRHDSAVLYLDSGEDCNLLEALLAELYRLLEPLLEPGIPALTKALAPGVGWAEQPGSGDSFGWHRCGLIAQGLFQGHRDSSRSPEAALAAVERRFLEEDVSLEAPYLRGRSSRNPEFASAFAKKAGRTRKAASPASGRRSGFEQLARRIAGAICAEAIWQRDRCVWLGAEPIDIRAPEGDAGIQYRTLGPEVYDGTAGVALFLAECFRITGDKEAQRTAAGAMNQSLARLELLPPPAAAGSIPAGWVSRWFPPGSASGSRNHGFCGRPRISQDARLKNAGTGQPTI